MKVNLYFPPFSWRETGAAKPCGFFPLTPMYQNPFTLSREPHGEALDCPRFVADSMLGSLARKLRMLGIDVLFLKDAPDSELKFLVRSQSRILLSRDGRLVETLGSRAWLVDGANVREEFLSIAPSLAAGGCRTSPMSLCLICGGKLVPVSPASAGSKVPPYILERGLDLSECSGCGKIFWHGTHWKRMEEEIRWMEEEIEKRRRPDAQTTG